VNVTVNKERPVNLDLGAFRWPVTAIASILHRISGVALFVGVAFLIWGLGASLESQESFESVKECVSGFLPKLILWAIVSGLIYHLIAGCKHLLMDIGVGETLEGGQLGAKIVLGLSVVLIVLAGVWIW
jgi:succinate dehydrogenase / fumarate reductase cytochrome b subunit